MSFGSTISHLEEQALVEELLPPFMVGLRGMLYMVLEGMNNLLVDICLAWDL